MASAESETNKTEEATPFKLKRARDKGTLARSPELGFFGALAAFAIFAQVSGGAASQTILEAMRRSFNAIAGEPRQALVIAWTSIAPAAQPIGLLCATLVVVVVFLEILQNRGLIFSTSPLKPDFDRLNPAKNLKRLFSTRLLKETLKSVLKLTLYATAAYLAVRYAIDLHGDVIGERQGLAIVLQRGAMRLLLAFLLLALGFAILDQFLARREFRKTMRMSRRELTQEVKEREGDPRLRHKRKQLHAQFTKQLKDLGGLKGSDMLVVNPQHYAVALAYDPRTMTAPKVTAKGRNRFALLLKRKAGSLSIVIFENPVLARALHRGCETGQEIGPNQYRAVADLYLRLHRHKDLQAHAVS